MKNYLNIAGWYGVFAILLAYLLLSISVISSNSLTYQLLNLSGALGIIIEAKAKKDIQPVVLNIIWAVIAVFAIIKLTIK